MGREGTLVALPELPADGLTQDAGGDVSPGVLIELLEQLEFLGCQGQPLSVFPHLRLL